jgi:dTDP-4-dehydrorhamnose 3,5-epimerase
MGIPLSNTEQRADTRQSTIAAALPRPASLLFQRTKLKDAWLIEPEPATDQRGYFMRTFCALEFAKHGLETRFVQHSTSYSSAAGTVRGMHFQRSPHDEVKLVSCLRGAIWDVIIDLRPQSVTYMHHEAYLLNDENQRRLYVPAGFAHGFQTLTADAEVGYLISAFYVPEAASGVRYDDPHFAISWPLPVTAISERDRNWPDFTVATR